MAYRTDPADRLKAAIGTAVVVLGMGYAFVAGLAVRMPNAVSDSLALFTPVPDRPPPPVEKSVPSPRPDLRPEGAAAPPNLRSTPAEIVAPPPIVPVTIPPPVVVAPIPGAGPDPSAGAADIPGPGTGSGGEGTGTGGGGSGSGGGRGDDFRTPPRHIRGRIRNSDYPKAAGAAGVGGLVSVRYVVQPNGRVTDCTVTRSSGSPELDETTCRLITERFVYEPSRDRQGRPLRAVIVADHEWIIDDRFLTRQGR